jgi:hypothetical protein
VLQLPLKDLLSYLVKDYEYTLVTFQEMGLPYIVRLIFDSIYFIPYTSISGVALIYYKTSKETMINKMILFPNQQFIVWSGWQVVDVKRLMGEPHYEGNLLHDLIQSTQKHPLVYSFRLERELEKKDVIC